MSSACRRTVTWREPDEEPDGNSDRDARVVRYASRKGAGRQSMEPFTPGCHQGIAWGGTQRRMSDAAIAHSRQDETPLQSARHVPIGYAKYTSEDIDLGAYKYEQMDGWRIALPRSTSPNDVKNIRSLVSNFGPQSIGYVRIGDTLVPGALGPGARQALAG